MFFGIAAGGLLAATSHVPPLFARVCFLLAAVMVQLRLVCNLLDGMVAVKTHRASRTGELFNEIPDRISDPATLIGAGYALGGLPWLGYIAACMALFTAYIRAVGKVAGAQQEFCGPMAKQQRMALVTVACLPAAIWTTTPILTIALWIVLAGELLTVPNRLIRIAIALRKPRV